MNGHNTRAPTKSEDLINGFLHNANLKVHHGTLVVPFKWQNTNSFAD
jgi:hypothetical protein